MKQLPVQIIICSLLIILSLLFSQSLLAQEEILARNPAISPDGSQISFSYQGDIWVAPYEGGVGIRLTLHESYESNPVFTRDGKHLVFSGNRYGNNDLFKVDIAGTQIERLTYHSASNVNPGIQSDGTIFFNTRRAYATVEREWEIFRLDPGIKTPYRAMDALGFSPTPTENGRLIAFEKGTAPTNREPYTGPAVRNIFTYHTDREQYHQITDGEAMHVNPKWVGNTLFYLSSESGTYNLYSQEIGNNGQKRGDARQITSF
nr:PD40 domain-containing protein [Saprospiraceae bacterium]